MRDRNLVQVGDALVNVTIGMCLAPLIAFRRTYVDGRVGCCWPEADNRKDCFQEGFVYVIAAACAIARRARDITGAIGNEETIKIISIPLKYYGIPRKTDRPRRA